MFSIIFPENSRIWVNLLPPDDLMSSSSTWKHSGPSHLPKKITLFSEDATNSPENLTNNEHVPSVCIQQLICWANKRSHFAAVPIPQTTNSLACRIFSLSCCDCNTPSSEMGWSRCHTSFTKHLQMFCSFGTVTQATEPLALRCELHLTKHPAVFETAAKAVEKKKNATRQMYHPKKSSSKKTRRFGWFLQCVSDFLKENAWNKSKIHWSVGPSLRSQETSGASQSS